MLRFRSAIVAAWACSLCVACSSADDDSEQMQQPASGAAVGGSLVPPAGAGGAGGMMMTVPPPAAGTAGTPVMMPTAGTPATNAGGGMGGAGSGGVGGMAGGNAGSAGKGGMAGSAGMGGAGSGGMGGSAGSAGSGMGAGATFSDVYAIISMKCGGGTTGCHVSGKSGGLQMPNKATARMNLVGVDSQECPGNKRVAAGDPDESILVGAIEGTACVQRMPRGKPALSADEIAKFRSWVQAGALDN